MKILHTADWHLGARLGRHDRMPDQVIALRSVLEVARDQQPDLILHAGDLFDTARPPYEALELGVQALGQLAAIAPTVVLCGNHDSPALFRVVDRLAAAAQPRRLWMVDKPQVLDFQGLVPNPVAITCVPFLSPAAAARINTSRVEQQDGGYADAVRFLNEDLVKEAQGILGPQGILIHAAHLSVHGARPGRSERRMTVSEDYATRLAGLEQVCYCAFGHIHDPQLLPGREALGRYSGSLVPLDYGERVQRKQVVLVSIADEVAVEPREISTGRPLVEIDGTVDELEQRAADGGLDGHILKARIHSKNPIPNLADRLLRRSPQCVVFDLHNVPTNHLGKPVDAVEQVEEPSLAELFREWRTSVARGIKAPHDLVTDLFNVAIGSVGQREDPDLGVAELGSRVERVLVGLDALPKD